MRTHFRHLHSLKIWDSIETPTPKMGAHLGMWGFIPSHSSTFPGAWNVIPRLHSWPAPSQPLTLVTSLRLGSWHILHVILFKIIYDIVSSVTTNTKRIPHRFLYFKMLSSNLKSCRNMVFLSFDYINFNIIIFPMTIYTLHSCFLCNHMRFLS